MSPTIKLKDEIYNRLASLAEGFDTPANVIERLLNHYEGTAESTKSDETQQTPKKVLRIKQNYYGERDTTKYEFQGRTYGKGRLVLAVMTEYANQHPDITYNALQDVFPVRLQGSKGVFDTLENANEEHLRTSHKRHFLKHNETIQIADTEIAISTEWGKGNIDNFLLAARDQGIEISEINQ